MKPLTLALSAAIAIAATAAPQRQAPEILAHPDAFTDTAPPMFHAVFDTTAGAFVVEVHRAWAPNGADRFYNLVKRGFYDACSLFRVVPNSLIQFGIHGAPAVAAVWNTAMLPIDRARVSNARGRVTFAQAGGPETRTTQVFINLKDNSALDQDGFAPFGQITSSMVLVERINSEYGERPDQKRIQREGNAFLVRAFPRLDYIRTAKIEP